MSDEEQAEVEVEPDAGSPQQADASQVVRMPHSFEFARAVLGVPGTPAWLGWLDKLTAKTYLPVTGVLWLGLVVCVLGGWVVAGVVLFVVAALFDFVAARKYVRETLLLRRLSVPSNVRIAIRGLLLVALFAMAGWPGIAVGVAAVVLCLVFAEIVQWVSVAWLSGRQPALEYNPNGAQSAAAVAYAKAYQKSSWQQPESMLVELLLGLVALAAALTGFGGASVISWAAVLGLAALALAGYQALTVRRLGSSGSVKALERDLQAKLDAQAPVALVYMSADAGQSLYILNQWVPTLEKLPHPGFILVREASHLAPIKPTPLPVMYAPSTRHVEELCRPSVKVAYYLANAGKNVHLLREARIRHVFLNHGDSDKSTSANPVSRVYDGVWVAGQAAIDRYEAAGIEIPREKYAIVGRPQVEALKVGLVGSTTDRPTILYAPTFEGYYEESNYSSLERMGPQLIRQILATHPEVRIIFKPHPASGVQRPGMAQARIDIVAMLAAAPGNHLYVGPESSLTLYECFDQAHVLISDISSVVTDFLYTERPLITSNPRRLDRQTFLTTFPTQGASYILERDLANLADLLTDALGPDSLREQRLAMKKYVLGDLPAGPTAAFVAEAARIAEESAAHAASIVNEFRVKT